MKMQKILEIRGGKSPKDSPYSLRHWLTKVKGFFKSFFPQSKIKTIVKKEIEQNLKKEKKTMSNEIKPKEITSKIPKSKSASGSSTGISRIQTVSLFLFTIYLVIIINNCILGIKGFFIKSTFSL